jgi:hypothetical protein
MTKLKVYSGMALMPGRNAHAVGQYHEVGQVTIYVSAPTKDAAYARLDEGGFTLSSRSGFKVDTGTAATVLIAAGVFAEPAVVVTHRMSTGPVLAFTHGIGARIIGQLVSTNHAWTFRPDVDPDTLFRSTFALHATQLANHDFPAQWLALAKELAGRGTNITAVEAAGWANLGFTPTEARKEMANGFTLEMVEYRENPHRARIWRAGKQIV